MAFDGNWLLRSKNKRKRKKNFILKEKFFFWFQLWDLMHSTIKILSNNFIVICQLKGNFLGKFWKPFNVYWPSKKNLKFFYLLHKILLKFLRKFGEPSNSFCGKELLGKKFKAGILPSAATLKNTLNFQIKVGKNSYFKLSLRFS